jgi:hypothetical protein
VLDDDDAAGGGVGMHSTTEPDGPSIALALATLAEEVHADDPTRGSDGGRGHVHATMPRHVPPRWIGSAGMRNGMRRRPWVVDRTARCSAHVTAEVW